MSDKMFTEKDLQKMHERTPERQFNVAMSKIIEAFQLAKGKLSISWSGGKDSSFMLYLVCMIWNQYYKDIPIMVTFADTTNEHKDIYNYVKNEFVQFLEEKFNVKIILKITRPNKNQTYVSVIKQEGIPLISKKVSGAICRIRKYLNDRNLTYWDVESNLVPTLENLHKLENMGLNKDATLILLGYSYKYNNFKSSFKLAQKWRPLIYAPFKISNKCCDILKKQPIAKMNQELGDLQPMIGEMACDSKTRRDAYLKTGCNYFIDGVGKSKPLGAMTEQGLFWNINRLEIPIAKCYGELQYINNEYKFSKAQRTGCCLCGFGIMHELDRFVKLQEDEPQKANFAFTSVENGGLGYKEACEYLNEHCKCKITIPKIKR